MSDMGEKRRAPMRLMLEVIVIVGSILMAFALQAWWESSGDRATEQALLRALAEDFESAARMLSDIKPRHEGLASAGEALISYGEAGSVPVQERARVDTLVSRHFDRPVFDPPMGTVQSVLGSGRIDLLRSHELVAELTAWPSLAERLRFAEVERRTHFNERLLPYLAARLDVEDMDKGYAQYVDFPWEQETTDAYRLLSDREFLNILYMHWVHTTNILSDLPRVEAALESMQTLVSTELIP